MDKKQFSWSIIVEVIFLPLYEIDDCIISVTVDLVEEHVY